MFFMNNLISIYPDSSSCSSCFGKTDRRNREGSENHSAWKGEEEVDDDDWEFIRENFALLGFTNYLPDKTARDGSDGTLQNGEEDEGVVEMYPLHQSCICRLTTRRAPKLLDVVTWPRNRLHSADPQNENNADVQPKRPDIDNYNSTNDECQDNEASNRTKNEDLVSDTSDDNVSLWNLRKNLEKNTVICLSEAASDLKSSCTIDNGPVNRGENVYSKQADTIAETKRHSSDTKEKSNPTSTKTDGVDTKKPHGKMERSMRHIRKYCKWNFKVCQDSVFDDDPEASHEEQKHSKPSVARRHSTDDGKRKLNRTTRLSVPGEDGLIETERCNGGTADSSSCSITPDSISSDSQRHYDCIVPDDMTTSYETSEISGKSAKSDSLQNLTRLFRRSSPKHRVSSPSYCGYSLERDYCVDLTTDRIFKEFLKPNPGENPIFPKRTPVLRNKTTQLRRQLMRKQYSDSAAVYYGQRMRRWRVKKQRSDSVNCPVDRAVLRRQDKINEEYYPDDLENEMSAPRNEYK